MNTLSMEQKTTILQALVEGCSIRSVERMTGHHRDTIMRLLVHAGLKAKQTMNTLIRDIPLKNLQIDELWTFVGKKNKMLTIEESGDEAIGSQFIFLAIDSETKFIPCFRVGKRNLNTATIFMWDLRSRVKGQPYLTTDGMDAYVKAIEWSFGYNANHAQLIKVYKTNGNPRQEGYSPVDFVLTKRNVVSGRPRRRRISTSYVERQNLTMRMSLRRLTRLTNAFSKKLDNLNAALYLYLAYYNFCRIHGSLRITPAMKAGITSHVWNIEEILNYSN